MAKCLTCGRVADRKAAVCSGCGRPNPTRARTGEIVAIVVAGLVLWMLASDPEKPARQPELDAEVGETAPASAFQDAGPAPSVADQAQEIGAEEAGAGFGHDAGATEPAEAALSNEMIDADKYPIEARLIDPRGKVVIQSGPSVFSKNVDTLTTGEMVRASNGLGKWVPVLLPDGRTGFVRRKQLEPVGR